MSISEGGWKQQSLNLQAFRVNHYINLLPSVDKPELLPYKLKRTLQMAQARANRSKSNLPSEQPSYVYKEQKDNRAYHEHWSIA